MKHSVMFLLCLLACADAGAKTLALVGGTLVDGTLHEPIRDSVILVENERIVAVGSVATLPVPAGAEVISTEGMTVMPGITSARDLGAPLEDSIAVRDAIAAGKIPGPTLYVSGPFIQKKPYPGT